VIALHAIWSSDRRLCLWGEDSAMPAALPRRPGRPPARPRARPHPFACPAEALVQLLDDAVFRRAQVGELALLLPSFADGPAASPRLLRAAEPPRRARSQPRFAPWTVPALSIGAQCAGDALLWCARGERPGLVIGDSVAFLAEVAKLALSLIARGRMAPGLVRGADGWLARWLADCAEATDARHLALLARSMPTLLAAQWREQEAPSPRAAAAQTPAAAPHRLTADILGALLDGWVRAMSAQDLLGGQTRRRRSGRARSAVQRWLAALTGELAEVEGEERELAALAEALEAWRGALDDYRSHRGFRTCFRLCAPEQPPVPSLAGHGDGEPPGDTVDPHAEPLASSASWRVEILLQSKDDPSVLVGAEQVWRANDGGVEMLGRRLENPQERLLGGLGHALRLWPELAGALAEPAPTAVELDAEGAFGFLREAVPRLEQAGFGVLAPPWWSQRLRLKLTASPSKEWEEGSGLFGLDGLCSFRWRIAVGDQTLSAAELHQLAQMKLPLVMSRGQWIVLRPEDVQAALRFFETHAESGEAPAAQLLREGLSLQRDSEQLPPPEIEAEGWLGALLEADADRHLQLLSTPVGFNGELRPYQRRGLSWLAFLSGLGVGACLADDMGLGKTAQTLALLLAERESPAARVSHTNGAHANGHARRQRRVAPTLLVCPTSVIGNWQRESERFAPSLRVHVHHGPERLHGARFAATARRCDLVITSYALAARDQQDLARVSWGRVALDEAQSIKTADAKQTRAVRALKARHRLALTGTPVENRLSELHSILDFLNPGLLGSATAFKHAYANPIERFRDSDATQRLRQVTAPFILRRVKTDRSIISDLPEKIEMRVDCHLTREQATLYQAVVEEMLEKAAQAEGIERQGVILAALMKLKQVCNHPAHLLKDRSELAGRSGKLARLEQILDEALAEGDKALCFTQFAEFGQLLRAHLQERLGREVLFLHGGTPRSAREEMVQRFQSDDGPAVFMLSLKAGGTGLNLTAANHVIHFDRWWNPAVEDQATDRAFRIGQHRNVQVRKLTCVGTLEERIDALIASKRDLAQRIVSSGERWITELDAGQLRELVTLSHEALEAAA
jgi:SNF2 family DNA or RNA helicase